MDKVTNGKGSSSSSSGPRLREKESFIQKLHRRETMRKAYLAKLQKVRDSLDLDPTITEFHPQTFGDDFSCEKISASNFKRSVVSIALFHDDVMVFACSGTHVRYRYGYIQGPHMIFVTSARLAHEFNANRTRDDKLRIELRTADNATMNGFLGLHDDNIAIVTSFSLRCLYSMDMCNPVDLPPGPGTRNSKLFAFGCGNDGTFMGTSCSHPVYQNDGLVSVNCEKITETALGGAVICFGRGGSGHLAGLIVGSCGDKTTFIPTKMLHEWLQHVPIASKSLTFRGYSLPKGVKSVISSGFMVRSTILQSLGYPLPPPLVLELNGGLVGTFEEDFGQLHYWEGYPFDDPYRGLGKPIWEQLGEKITDKISRSVVSIASFKGDVRCFACTGLLITSRDRTFVLTSANLVRTCDAQDEIDENLRFEVFLPPKQCVDGILELYHPNFNIAIFSLKSDLTAISPEEIVNFEGPYPSKVVAVGRRNKERHGVLMASMGKVKCTINRGPKVKEHHVLNLDCEDLVLSTCKIKKVGIGGPLIGLDGRFMGMNFYDETGTTPFLPSAKIVTTLERGFNLLFERGLVGCPVNMEYMDQPTRKSKRNLDKMKRNRWPVSKPYWYLAGQGDVLDQLGGKVLT